MRRGPPAAEPSARDLRCSSAQAAVRLGGHPAGSSNSRHMSLLMHNGGFIQDSAFSLLLFWSVYFCCVCPTLAFFRLDCSLSQCLADTGISAFLPIQLSRAAAPFVLNAL